VGIMTIEIVSQILQDWLKILASTLFRTRWGDYTMRFDKPSHNTAPLSRLPFFRKRPLR